jgi:hypothetical protein
MKVQLLNHFTEQEVIIGMLSHIDDHIVLRHEKSTKIIQNFYSATIKQSDKDKKNEIMKEVARLIKSDILSIPPNKKEFDLFHDLGTASDILSFIPQSLLNFLENIFTGKDIKRKIGAIGQAIVQAVRPKTIAAPLQLGLAITLHHLFGSRQIIDLIHPLGLCSSYGGVVDFERNSAVHINTDLEGYSAQCSVQHIEDNADHNIGTTDGKGTFHGMELWPQCAHLHWLERKLFLGIEKLQMMTY